MNRCSNHTKHVNPLIDLVVNIPLFRKFTGQNCDCAIFHPWGKKYRINYKGQIFKRSLAMQCLTKPRSKSFSICQTILSKHHLLWTVLWKHTEEKKTSIYLLKTTNQRRDLEVQRFVKPRLKLDFVWIFGPKSLHNKEGTPHCSRATWNYDHLRLRFRFRFHSICYKLKSPISKNFWKFRSKHKLTFRPGKGGLPPDMVLFGQSVRCKRNSPFHFS